MTPTASAFIPAGTSELAIDLAPQYVGELADRHSKRDQRDQNGEAKYADGKRGQHQLTSVDAAGPFT